jgi:hypothetical protein
LKSGRRRGRIGATLLPPVHRPSTVFSQPTVTVVVALVVVLAGCGGASSGSGEVRTVNPALEETPSPTATPTPTPEFPDGASPEGVDAFALAAAHAEAIAERNVTVRRVWTIRDASGQLLRRTTLTATLVGDALSLSYGREGPVPGLLDSPGANRSVWSNGSVTAVRVSQPDQASYRYSAGSVGETYLNLAHGRSAVYGSLAGRNLTLSRTVRTGDATIHVYRASDRRATDGSGDEIRNVSLVVRVTDEGLVRSIESRYVTRRIGQNLTVTMRLTVRPTDAQSIPRPEWVDVARNRSRPVGKASGHPPTRDGGPIDSPTSPHRNPSLHYGPGRTMAR